ncbi:hypothetical protein GCM10023318_18090 [Nocardia callitridis]|uniref:Uncharacterized protein n=2 Tax=Nocardia callitridis TaxID=648753 RepID=A0ABP9K4H7_9NOCA
MPLARTVKLILDPLVIRPALNPHLSGALLSVEAAAELRGLLVAAGDRIADAAAWFTLIKRARRQAGITAGNPQDLYFQVAYELAHLRGTPGADAKAVAAGVLAEVHDGSRPTLAELRDYVTDPWVADELRRAIDLAWPAADRGGGDVPHDILVRFLDACAENGAVEEFDALVAKRSGSASTSELEAAGAAHRLGLTDRDRPTPPEPGMNASKATLPPPFDRSVFERLFASFAAVSDSGEEIAAVVRAEIARSAGGWQLAEEASRVLLLAATRATVPFAGDEAVEREGADNRRSAASTDAAKRMLARWLREPFVHRALRLADANPETQHVREAVMRRLWVRLHGRELRGEPVTAAEAWGLLDGALRSVILDRRDRVKAAIWRKAVGGTP